MVAVARRPRYNAYGPNRPINRAAEDAVWIKQKYLKHLANAEKAAYRSPVPTQMVSNGEYMPMAQTPQQKEVEDRIKVLADELGKKLGLGRRDFLRTSSGTAAAFMAMNKVFGTLFAVEAAEAADLAAAEERRASLADEFIFDVQTHHVRSNFDRDGLLNLTAWAQGRNEKGILINPELGREPHTIDRLKFDHYVKDIFLDSDVKIAILSGFTSETPEHMALTTDEIIESRTLINQITGSQRLMGHGLFWPGKDGNLEEMERVAKDLKIDSWKGYTVGDPGEGESQYPWFMDDEKVAFPCWELADKLGIRNVCIHKGLIPPDYETFTNWKYAAVDDIAGAAKAFPNINFIIYHSALRPSFSLNAAEQEFEKSGYIPWVTDLARLPKEHGVKNVYAEIGTSFASAVVTHPRMAAGMLGQLIEGFGADHVVFGTDSIWYGTPQWQIEALRRLEIPEDLQKKHGFAPLGPATGKVKRALFGLNGARVFGVDVDAQRNPMPADYKDKLAEIKAEYRAMGGKPDNTYYGWVNTG